MDSPPDGLTHRRALDLAWPIILANAAVPLLGLADTAVIGNAGAVDDLGAVALGSLIFNFVYWTFGFLRMGTTGFVAQAGGRGDEPEVRAAILRALCLGVGLGLLLWVLQGPIVWAALAILSGAPAVEAGARAYVLTRIWGAPATLGTFAVMGGFIGLGMGRQLLSVQVFLSGLNIVLDVWFAGVLGWGARGIALGTAIAEWAAFALALALCLTALGSRRRGCGATGGDPEPLLPWRRARALASLRATLGANADIMLRTLCLLSGFGYFTNRSAGFGSEVLAGNHILLQLVSFSAFFLDGYAHVAEAAVGAALGAGDRRRFDRAVRVTSELAGVTAVALAAAIAVLGPHLLGWLTDLAPVRSAAARQLPLAALYVALAFAAFQLDGVFIGATRTRAMRDASALALAAFLVLGAALSAYAGNAGLWCAFIGYVVARAAALLLHFPSLRASVGSRGPSAVAQGPDSV